MSKLLLVVNIKHSGNRYIAFWLFMSNQLICSVVLNKWEHITTDLPCMNTVHVVMLMDNTNVII